MGTATEQTFVSFDGAEIFYRAWLPEGKATRAVLLFHRGHEHSGRWQETVEGLGMAGCAVFAWDQRGHGKSPGKRGHAPSFGALVKDADRLARHVRERYGVAWEEMGVVASSVGAVVASAWVHDYAPQIRALVLAAPAFTVRLYVPLAVPALRAREKFLPGGEVKSYVKSKMLTHDGEQAAAYEADPLIFRQISVKLLLELHDAGKRLVEDAAAIACPTLVLSAGRDWVVDLGAQRRFFARLGSGVKQMELFPELNHALFHELGRGRVVERIRGFLDECFARKAAPSMTVDADKGGVTRTEYDLLRGPSSLRWRAAQLQMKTFGRLSTGIRLGWRTGFDSGKSLDYVYENRSRGITPLGKVIDHFYLQSIGWRGIRLRRGHLEQMLKRAMRELHAAGQPVRIVDIAAGVGRYVLETMRELREVPASAVLRDNVAGNVAACQELAAKLGVDGVTVVQGDAFDRAALASLTPPPTIGIVSGLYELFPENVGVRESLRGLGEAVEEGGVLIYTCQPWHPQMEFIGRVLTNREGKPWVMRRRMQGEMDCLVGEAGFEKVDQEIDPWGIFTVSLARRVKR